MRSIKALSIASLLAAASCGSGGETSSSGEDVPIQASASGSSLFANNCAVCHAISTDKNGPALAGVIERWNNDTARLAAYISNSQEVIKTDPYAEKLFHDWSNMVMPPFPQLSDAEVMEIIRFIGEGKD